MKGKGMLLVALTMAMLTQVSNAVYFYAQKGKWRCFADTVVKNNVSDRLGRSVRKESDTYGVVWFRLLRWKSK
jgi:hypothetical protein